MRTPDTDEQGNRLSFRQLDRMYSVKAGLAAGVGVGVLNFGILPYTKLGATLAERRGARSIISVLSGARVFAITVAYFYLNDALTDSLAKNDFCKEHPALTRSFIGFNSGGLALFGARIVTSGFKGSIPASTVGALGGTALEFLEYQIASRWEAARNRSETGGILQSLSQSQMFPLQSLSDKDYGDRLREKLAFIEKEIEDIDGEITAAQAASDGGVSR